MSLLQNRLRLDDARSRVRRIVRSSVVSSSLSGFARATANAIRTALETSRVVNAIRTLSRWTRHSFLYRWLTSEPDPEVVVIDLRETYTVGPIIAVLVRLVSTLAPWYRESGLKRLGGALGRLADSLAESRTGRVLIAVFEPPEPPEGGAEDAENDSR